MKWHIEKCADGWYIVLDTDLDFTLDGTHYVVPAGFRSDGMSVPRWLWSIVSPRLDFITLVPSVIHDWLYATHIVARAVADGWYREALVRCGYGIVKAFVVWLAIKIFGYWHLYRHVPDFL